MKPSPRKHMVLKAGGRMVAKVEDLDFPPVVGRYYMVPCVYLSTELTKPWGALCYGMLPGWWPVTGPKHEDKDIVGFDPWHYHFDARFLSQRQLRNRVELHDLFGNSRPDEFITACALCDSGARKTPEPEYRRVRCRRPALKHMADIAPLPASSWVHKLEAAFSGKTLKTCHTCPHRGIPLGSLPVARDGTVTCPGHGLRWDAMTGKLVPRPRKAIGKERAT